MKVFPQNGTGLLYAAGLGAVALLTLKIIGFVSDRPYAQSAGIDNYGRVMARKGIEVLDPNVTGSVSGDAKKEAAVEPAKPAERHEDGTLKKGKELPTPTSNNIVKSKPNTLETPFIEKQTPAEKALLERLGERRQQLELRDRDIDTREKLLESTEKKVEERIHQLKELEEKANQAAAKKSDSEGQSLKNVVVMYETMKAKEAAKVFDRLSMDILLPVVVQMNPKKMSEILAAMSPETAEKLTVALSIRARNAEAKSTMTQMTTGNLPLSSTELPAIEPPAPKRR
jgi:flagellar motility protein MotE (MotC chaperone)